jgi:excinuclease ABC subunit C
LPGQTKGHLSLFDASLRKDTLLKVDPNKITADKLSKLPRRPGVYFWKNGRGTVIYVGKAKVLRQRVRSYFQDFMGKDGKTRLLVAQIRDLDWIVTQSEQEALILENTLIKKYRPRYNVRLRDDKNYLSLRLSTNEDFPRLSIVRKISKDGATYFGPYSNAKAIRTTLRFLNKHFPIRKCDNAKFQRQDRPCLNYQIGQCEGACSAKIDKEAYGKIVRQVKMFFDGKSELLTHEMTAEMERAAKAMEFEKAARYRDAIRAIKASIQRQNIVTDDFVDRDIFGLYREGGAAVVSILYLRNGSILGHRALPLSDMELPDDEILASVVKQYYGGQNLIPKELIIGCSLGAERAVIKTWLAKQAGRQVRVLVPKRGRKKALLSMAEKNAQSQFEIHKGQILDREKVLEKIQRRLHLRNFPHRIECYDISNLQGTHQVASQVLFVDGEPEKSGYRKYKIRTVQGQDDFGSMKEVLMRRFANTQRQTPQPDLLMIDGGKGQLNIALAVLLELGLNKIDTVGFTKIRNAARGTPEDMAYLPGRKNAVRFLRGGDDLFLLQRVRDESHRFAIEFHRKLRSKAQRKSVLDIIPGVGPSRKRALIKHFGSVRQVGLATAKQIAEVKGIPENLAEQIHKALANGKQND